MAHTLSLGLSLCGCWTTTLANKQTKYMLNILGSAELFYRRFLFCRITMSLFAIIGFYYSSESALKLAKGTVMVVSQRSKSTRLGRTRMENKMLKHLTGLRVCLLLLLTFHCNSIN